MPSPSTPTPPAARPCLYRGRPPGSPERPSGSAAFTSLHGSCENCTPNSGPLDVLVTPGGKCCCTMNDALRVENALPCVLKNAAVPALEIAAMSEPVMDRTGISAGIGNPSKPGPDVVLRQVRRPQRSVAFSAPSIS